MTQMDQAVEARSFVTKHTCPAGTPRSFTSITASDSHNSLDRVRIPLILLISKSCERAFALFTLTQQAWDRVRITAIWPQRQSVGLITALSQGQELSRHGQKRTMMQRQDPGSGLRLILSIISWGERCDMCRGQGVKSGVRCKHPVQMLPFDMVPCELNFLNLQFLVHLRTSGKCDYIIHVTGCIMLSIMFTSSCGGGFPGPYVSSKVDLRSQDPIR